MNDLGLDLWQEQKTFLLCKNIQTSSGAPSSLIFIGYWDFSPPSGKFAGVGIWPLTSI